MTLGRFFKEYVYIPLGGNKVKVSRNILNLFIVWFLTGIWHGADYNFALWGLFLFVVMVLERYVFRGFFDKHPVAGHIYMIVFIPVNWLIFTITNIRSLCKYLLILFGIHIDAALISNDVLFEALKNYGVFIVLGVILSTRIPFIVYGKLREKRSIWLKLIAFGVFSLATYLMVQGLDNPFLYFRF